jgi:hypothetical protein
VVNMAQLLKSLVNDFFCEFAFARYFSIGFSAPRPACKLFVHGDGDEQAVPFQMLTALQREWKPFRKFLKLFIRQLAYPIPVELSISDQGAPHFCQSNLPASFCALVSVLCMSACDVPKKGFKTIPVCSVLTLS